MKFLYDESSIVMAGCEEIHDILINLTNITFGSDRPNTKGGIIPGKKNTYRQFVKYYYTFSKLYTAFKEKNPEYVIGLKIYLVKLNDIVCGNERETSLMLKSMVNAGIIIKTGNHYCATSKKGRKGKKVKKSTSRRYRLHPDWEKMRLTDCWMKFHSNDSKMIGVMLNWSKDKIKLNEDLHTVLEDDVPVSTPEELEPMTFTKQSTPDPIQTEKQIPMNTEQTTPAIADQTTNETPQPLVPNERTVAWLDRLWDSIRNPYADKKTKSIYMVDKIRSNDSISTDQKCVLLKFFREEYYPNKQ